jgi:hypothetical protein
MGRQVTDSMRTFASPLAALLSLLMATTSLSASACDLSCWLHEAHSSCPIASSRAAAKAVAATSTPAGTSITPHHCGGMIASRTSSGSAHSVLSSTAIPALLVRHSRRPESPSGPWTFSSCPREDCGERSAFTFPSKADRSQTVAWHSTETRFLSSFNSRPRSRYRRLESPPSEVSAADCSPLTTLRI